MKTFFMLHGSFGVWSKSSGFDSDMQNMLNGPTSTLFKNHTLNLKPIYFDLIKSGEKVLEGRLNDEKRKLFDVGDGITFYKESERKESLQAIILHKYFFKNFEEMANNLNKKDLGFDKYTKEEMVKTYRMFYNQQDENKYGVVVFKIKLL